LHTIPVGAAEGCDLLTLVFQDQKIAAFGSSYGRFLQALQIRCGSGLARENGGSANINVEAEIVFASKPAPTVVHG